MVSKTVHYIFKKRSKSQKTKLTNLFIYKANVKPVHGPGLLLEERGCVLLEGLVGLVLGTGLGGV